MSDLISRQAAIDLVKSFYKIDKSVLKIMVFKLKQLPSAQPETNCSEIPNSSDSISRQAAIDALDEIRHALWEIDIPSPTVPEYVEHHEQVQSVWKLLDKKQKELYVLPSVHPELSNNSPKLENKNGELISRQKAIDAVDKRFDGIPMEQTQEILMLRRDLRTLPSVQPERKRGKWIYGEHDVAMCDGYRCDKCGFFVPWDYQHKSIDFIKDYNYCPSCGADMRGRGDSDE